PPGGVFDIVGRPWADKVKVSLGSVFVDNQPGAGGSLAAEVVAHAPADGYTIFLGSSSIHLTEMILREHPLLDPMKELTPVSMVALTCFAIVVNPNLPVHSLGELIAYCKSQSRQDDLWLRRHRHHEPSQRRASQIACRHYRSAARAVPRRRSRF